MPTLMLNDGSPSQGIAPALDAAATRRGSWNWPVLMSGGSMRTLASLMDQAIFALTTFGTGVVIGRLLLEDEFAVYYLAMTLVIVMRNVQGELVSAPYAVFRQRVCPSERSAYAGSVVMHQVVVSFAGLVPVALMLLAASVGWISSRMIPTLMVLMLVTPLLMFRGFLRSFSFASYRFWGAFWIDATVGATQLAGLTALYLTGELTVAACYAVMGLACLAGMIAWRCSGPERLRFEPRRYWSDWRSNWKFSRWALASQLLGTTAPYAVPWLLEAHHGGSTTGVYGACFTFIGLSMHFVTAVANYLTPRAAAAFADEGRSGLARVLGKTSLLYLVVIGAIGLGVWALGDLPVQWVYGPSYSRAATTCLLFAGFTLAISMSVVAGNGLWAMNRPEANLWADAATMTATLAGAFWLIPSYGREGAAAAMLVGATLGAAVRIWTLRIHMRE